MFSQQGDQYQDFISCPPRQNLMDRIWKPSVEIAPNCPRCDSSNTKFCYYNNYSLTQPRYFCKGCRRYWTKGGSLRNVPVGGGCRKNRRGKSVRISSSNRTSSPGTTSTSSGGGGGVGGGCSLSQIGLPMGNNNSNNGMVSSLSSTNPSHDSSSNIDLALVYAKFLNNQPHSNSRVSSNIPTELPRDQFNSSFEFSSIISEYPNNFQLPQEQCMAIGSSSQEPQLSEGNRQVFLGNHNQLDLNYKQRLVVEERIPQFTDMETSSYMLPPSEEVVLHDNLWLNSPSGSNFPWQNSTQFQGYEPIVEDQSNSLDNNWASSFDLPNYEAFPRQ